MRESRRRTSLNHQASQITASCLGGNAAEAETMTAYSRTSAFIRGRRHGLRGAHSALLLISTLSFAIITVLLTGSVLGTARPLIPFLDSKEQPKQRPWIRALEPSRHVFRDPETIHLYWNVSAGFREPDGVKKRVYLVNDTFPGPTIEARSGDELVVHVLNSLPDEGVSLHWHGLKLRGQNAFDGAVGVTQCPIPPGRSFTYTVRIGDDEAGTFWWHAHSQLQRGDGLYGGLVVHRAAAVSLKGRLVKIKTGTEAAEYGYDRDSEHLLMIGDWFHRGADEILAWYTSTKAFRNEPVPDSLLVNGRGRFDCSMAVPARPVECKDPGGSDVAGPVIPALAGRTRLRIVNVGTIAGYSLAVPGATMRPIQVDGGCEVKADVADGVGVLYPGERMDVILDIPESETAAPRLLIALDNENFRYPNPSLNPNQSFILAGSGTAANPSSFSSPAAGPFTFRETVLKLLSLTSVESRATVAVSAKAQHKIMVFAKTQILARLHNHPTGFINQTTWQPQIPPLISTSRSSWDEHQLVPFVPLSGTDDATKSNEQPGGGGEEGSGWIDLVINNLDDGSHPFHLHGHSFFVLSTYRADHLGGWGSFNPFPADNQPSSSSFSSFNLVNPLRKDTIVVPRRGHVVLRFRADNPGLWMLHCHMLVHLGSGMSMTIHVGDALDREHVASGLDGLSADLCMG